MTAVAIDLDAVLGDTRALWNAWLDDLGRRARLELDLPADRAAAAAELEHRVGNWRVLLARFAEEHAPVYLRPDAGVATALRHLQAEGAVIGVFTDAPEPLARIALAHLGAERRVQVLKAGATARERLLAEVGADAAVIESREQLATAAAKS